MLKWETTSTQCDIHCSKGDTHMVGGDWAAPEKIIIHMWWRFHGGLGPSAPLWQCWGASDVGWEWPWCCSQQVSHSLEQSFWLCSSIISRCRLSGNQLWNLLIKTAQQICLVPLVYFSCPGASGQTPEVVYTFNNSSQTDTPENNSTPSGA